MGQPADRAGSACVWVVAAVLLLALLAGGGCLVLYVALPPAEVPRWLPVAGLALVAFPWAFWIATCAYRCCCCSCLPEPGAAAAAAPGKVERQPSSPRSPAAVAPLPSSTKNLKSALSTKHTGGRRSPSPHSGVRRVRFGDSTVLGEEAAEEEAAAGEEETKDDDDAASVHSHESEEPLAYSMHSS